MTILFAGGEMGAFIPSDSTVLESTSTSNSPFNSSFARCAISIDGSTSYAEGQPSASDTDAWIRFDLMIEAIEASSTYCTHFIWYDDAGIAAIRARYSGSLRLLRIEYSADGSAWSSAGSDISLDMGLGNRQTISIHAVVNSAAGSINVYVSGTNRLSSGALDLSGIPALDKFRVFGGTISASDFRAWVSQVIMADESTIGMRLRTVPATGAGADTAWTGTYTEIDEAVYSDADFVNSPTADQVELFAQSTTVPTGYVVQAVVVTARAKKGSSGPANLQLAVRSNGTNYFSSSQALDEGYGAHFNVWETDPATSADWTTSAANAIQFGVKSIT